MQDKNNDDSLQTRGIYLLPNLLTTAGLFSGFYAVVSSMNGHFISAAIAIFIAMIFDGLDGRVARMTNTQSEFGAEYDSMADMLSFGIAPGIVAYNWALSSFGKFGWLAAFVYVACAALRLARFNTQVGIADKRYFQGLASPAAAGVVASLIWVGSEYQINGQDYGYIIGLITIVLGLLMVSNFRYNSFKEVDWKGKVNFVVVLLIVLAFVVIASSPENILLIIFGLYACSGPFTTIRSVKKLKLEHVLGDDQDADFMRDSETKAPENSDANEKSTNNDPK
ncbi:CDP-diacylglycerol--serine O-phosphatidyltransferase [Colwellia sp. 6M3]|jgi:CDP-diacylglycerol--serine O-phosphatidyltransferase|uniref:CDP-diacylglycerol--serine O-phosphatidyltransferase n=1 Tax=Colwellia sp. 6M3 TaxID=2759849 RepID=UPI0015F3FE0B|nr:CDP-diacylglycerol--serine O-phosphatidyltransferase [Colwellia sp. 6M3]MBA6417227.1 CDP-diacylglycerol--serine O-phosphatidyltransferase [Colwellia sp. 6M3]|tara:strand:+ start:6945 stop:7787 length:843 start_codon:yes stop_codon:yes gene_type:complete